MKELTHTNAKGEARMVDVSDKSETSRVAEAEATVLMKPETLNRVMEGNIGKG
ncbi:MAG TPA: cyclic pyranopterin monophosphate synthase MoaC, partial [Gammaproteobacteria bacterium]|nr:cyclic pyranopterin monophosphate synthase MoaC [Gammaproteobacteria bacterium]